MNPWALYAVLAAATSPTEAVAPGEQPSVIAMTSLRAEAAVEPGQVAPLDPLVLQELSRYPGIRVLGQSDIVAMLSQEAAKQLVGCSDESCLAEIGGALGAALLIDGSVSRLEADWLVSLKLLDTERGMVLARSSEQATSLEALAERVPSLVEGLFKDAARSGEARATTLAHSVGWRPLGSVRRVAPYVVGAAGLGLLVAGALLDLSAERHASDARSAVAGTPAWRDAKELAESRARVGDSLLIGGALVAGAASLLYVWNARAQGGVIVDVTVEAAPATALGISIAGGF